MSMRHVPGYFGESITRLVRVEAAAISFGTVRCLLKFDLLVAFELEQ
jgi:hypothetical protein